MLLQEVSLALIHLLGGGRIYHNLEGDNSHTQFEMFKDVDLGLAGIAQRTWEMTTWLFLAQSLRQVRLNEILLDYSRDAALVVM